MPEEEYSSVTVYPKPGMCIKTKNDKGAKFFLNLCRVDEIPAPTPMKGYYFGPRFFFSWTNKLKVYERGKIKADLNNK